MVVLLDVAVDGGLEIDDGMKHATLEALAGERGEEAFHGVQPGAGSRARADRRGRIDGICQAKSAPGSLSNAIVLRSSVTGRSQVRNLS